MAHVKWLTSITVLDRQFEGYQQAIAYQYRRSDADSGTPVTRILPRALMVPPGVPDFMSRVRFMGPSKQLLEGRAWSGRAPVNKVEVSDDSGVTWHPAALGDTVSPFAWRYWSFDWDATRPGEYELCVRATDEAGNVQPTSQAWNREGVQNNAVQRVRVVVGESKDGIQRPASDLEVGSG